MQIFRVEQKKLKSNSKSKFEFWTGFRTSINIPSDDHPFIDVGGFNLLPFGNPWNDPYMNFEGYEFSKNFDSVEEVWTMNIDHYWNLEHLIESVEPEVYCRKFSSPQNFSLAKKAGKTDVSFDEEYVNAYDFNYFEAPEMFMYIPHIESI